MTGTRRDHPRLPRSAPCPRRTGRWASRALPGAGLGPCRPNKALITNRVSAVLVNLPVGEADPLRRLTLLRGQMDDIKQTYQAVGAEILTEMLGFAAPTLLAIGSRAAFRLPQPLVQTVTTNVPGPRFPLYILGRRMAGLSVRADRRQRANRCRDLLLPGPVHLRHHRRIRAVPDLDVLAEGIGRALAELRAIRPVPAGAGDHPAAAG